MSKNTKAALRAIFEKLDCDLEVGFVACLAESMRISPPEIYREYEAWQIEE